MDIFLSYSKEDRKIAKTLFKELTAEGYEVWYDVNLMPGQTFSDKIIERLGTAKAVIVLWTLESVKSNWVLSEANRGLSYKKLIPIVADGLTAIDLPAPHDTIHFIRANERKILRDTLESLGVTVATAPWKPLQITKFERCITRDVAGGIALDCNYAEGQFTRDEAWHFEIFFDDKPNDHTFPQTRFSEFYIKHCGITQWWWGAGDDPDERPDWHYGWLLLHDLIHGLAHITV